MKRKRKLYICCLAMLAALFLGGIMASAETVTVNLTGRYGQTEAREMLAMINDFRTGSEAWYWNETDTEKIYETGLQPLVYDYQLEQAAMLRAMEIAVYYGHSRPNGTGPVWSLLGPGLMAAAENIAVGQTSAAEVFQDWQETNENYEGQGHRRNMLSSDVTAVGIGHVYYNGYHCWVQVFRSPALSTSETPANDSETTVPVEVDSSVITYKEAQASVDSLSIPYGSTASLPEITGGIMTTGTWIRRICPIGLSYEWTSADTEEAYIKLDNSAGTITAVGFGTTEITATVAETGTVITIPVTVVRIPLSSTENPAQVTLDQDSFIYSGEEYRPTPTVTLDGTELTVGTDYTVEYENNTNAGTAAVKITGAGNYEGTLTKEFTINPKELGSESFVTVTPEELVYTGSRITPEVTVTCEGKELDPASDYEITYKNNKNAGQASVEITAKGNYTGELTGTFTILPLELEEGVRKEDPATGTIYTVTGTDATGQPTVEYTVPGNPRSVTVNIPATVTLDEVKYKVTSIASNAFKNNKKIKKVVIGKNVAAIGSYAFRNCTKLSSVTIGAGVTEIKAGAFYGCTSLNGLTIPAKVTVIGKQALYNCKKLTKIVIKTTKLTTKSVGKNAFGKLSSKVTIKVPKNKLKEYKKLLKGKGLGAKAKIN